MKMLRMKKEDSIDKHIAKFRMMVFLKLKLDKSSPVIIDLFRETLSILYAFAETYPDSGVPSQKVGRLVWLGY